MSDTSEPTLEPIDDTAAKLAQEITRSQAPPPDESSDHEPYVEFEEAEISVRPGVGEYGGTDLYQGVKLYDIGVRAEDMDGVILFPWHAVVFVREPHPVKTANEELQEVLQFPGESQLEQVPNESESTNEG